MAKILSKRNSLITLQIQKDTVRTEKLDGKTYLVSPVVPIVEGVHNREFISYEELTVFPEMWDGRPLPIDHPQDSDGNPITAGSPEVMESSVVGFLFRVQAREDIRGISGEIWVDLEKAQKVPGGDEVIKRLNEGSQLEVSTAYYTLTDNVPGEWMHPVTKKVEKYTGSQFQIRPDHLALLPFDLGACSWKDGCGAPRTNSDASDAPLESKVTEGQKMPDTKSLTVNGKQLGRALAAAISAHVGADGTTNSIINRLAVAADISVAKVTDVIEGRMDFAPRTWLQVFAAVLDVDAWEFYYASSNDNTDLRYSQNGTEKVAANADSEKSQENISEEKGDAVTTSHNGEVKAKTCGPCSKSLKAKVLTALQSVGLLPDDAVEETPQEPAPEAKVIENEDKAKMDIKVKIDALIASGKFAENQRGLLETMNADQLALLEPKAETPVETKSEAAPAVNAEVKPEAKPAVEPAKEVAKPAVNAEITKDQVLKALGISESALVALQSAEANRKSEREAKIAQLAAVPACPYAKEELETMSDAILDKTLQVLAPEVPFRVGAGRKAQNGDSNAVPAPPAILLAQPNAEMVGNSVKASRERKR